MSQPTIEDLVALIETTKSPGDGGFTTREFAELAGVCDAVARRYVTRLRDEGRIRSVRVRRADMHDLERSLPGWEIVDRDD